MIARIALLAAARREGRQIQDLPPGLSPADAKAACAIAHAIAPELC